MQRACALSVTVAGCLPCRRVAAAGTVVQVLGSLLVRLRACQSSAAAGAPGQGAGSQDAPQAAMSSHATPAAPRNSGVAAQNQPNTMATALLRRGAVGVAASAAARRPGSVVPVARLGAGVAPRPARAAAAAPAFSRRHSVRPPALCGSTGRRKGPTQHRSRLIVDLRSHSDCGNAQAPDGRQSCCMHTGTAHNSCCPARRSPAPPLPAMKSCRATPWATRPRPCATWRSPASGCSCR